MKLTKARLKQLIKEELKLHMDQHVIFTPNPNYVHGESGRPRWLRKAIATRSGDITPYYDEAAGDIKMSKKDEVYQSEFWDRDERMYHDNEDKWLEGWKSKQA